jgi:HD superfamily phosphodiesterase
MIPSAEKCFELMEKYGMPNNIKAHSIVVEKIAYVIARGNIDAGFDISIEKVVAGSLMHDIGKSLCLNSKKILTE